MDLGCPLLRGSSDRRLGRRAATITVCTSTSVFGSRYQYDLSVPIRPPKEYKMLRLSNSPRTERHCTTRNFGVEENLIIKLCLRKLIAQLKYTTKCQTYIRRLHVMLLNVEVRFEQNSVFGNDFRLHSENNLPMKFSSESSETTFMGFLVEVLLLIR